MQGISAASNNVFRDENRCRLGLEAVEMAQGRETRNADLFGVGALTGVHVKDDGERFLIAGLAGVCPGDGLVLAGCPDSGGNGRAVVETAFIGLSADGDSGEGESGGDESCRLHYGVMGVGVGVGVKKEAVWISVCGLSDEGFSSRESGVAGSLYKMQEGEQPLNLKEKQEDKVRFSKFLLDVISYRI